MPEFATSIDIEAEPAFVFDFLTTNAGMNAWMGQWSDLDPVVGGRFSVNIAGDPIRGEYLEVDPPHRVVVSWGLSGSDELPAGSTTVAFTLTKIESGTRVDLVHSNLPQRYVPAHAEGWVYFLQRLSGAATGVDLPPSAWQSPDIPA